eukprot:TRINITY_DN332_c1_g1_i1.p1 TRINITY_DN332_c1_g1~~TRINITY_DN332_c1_g1_i1.p1  ORF type:complete len:166 (+),score=56.54 TRINITY_DN332_c1_g1_i1:82-579(+)
MDFWKTETPRLLEDLTETLEDVSDVLGVFVISLDGEVFPIFLGSSLKDHHERGGEEGEEGEEEAFGSLIESLEMMDFSPSNLFERERIDLLSNGMDLGVLGKFVVTKLEQGQVLALSQTSKTSLLCIRTSFGSVLSFFSAHSRGRNAELTNQLLAWSLRVGSAGL